MYWKDYINSILPKPTEKCNEGTWTEVKSQKQEKVDKLKICNLYHNRQSDWETYLFSK